MMIIPHESFQLSTNEKLSLCLSLKGYVPGLLGTSHGALQFMAYEELKRDYNKYKNVPSDSKLVSHQPPNSHIESNLSLFNLLKTEPHSFYHPLAEDVTHQSHSLPPPPSAPAFVRRMHWSTSQWRRCRRYSPWSPRTPTRWCELACKTSTTPTAGWLTWSDGRGGTTPIWALIYTTLPIKTTDDIFRCVKHAEEPVFMMSALSEMEKKNALKILRGQDVQIYTGHQYPVYLVQQCIAASNSSRKRELSWTEEASSRSPLQVRLP